MDEATAADDPIIAAQERLQRLRSQQSPDNGFQPVPVPILSEKCESGLCRMCQSPLAADRTIQCAQCDEKVAAYWAARTAREADESALESLRRSGLPIDYRTGSRTLASLPSKVMTNALSTACSHLGTDLTRGLFLHGSAGSFKTSVAASCLAARIASTGRRGVYSFVPDLMADIHMSYRDEGGGESRSAIVDRLVSAPFLVLDDLGKEKASEHGAGVIFEIIDGRYRNWSAGRWLIVTSNFDLDALCDRFPEHIGDPIRRRIAEMAVQIEMKLLEAA